MDLITIGDCTLDTFITPSESETMCTLDTKECLICFKYGDKIPVRTLAFSVGGNAANNAVGASRLGLSVAIVTTFGKDPTGVQIHNALQNDSVLLDYAHQEEQGTSNSSYIVSYEGERTIFSHHAAKQYMFPESLPSVGWMYLTSLGEGYEEVFQKTLAWLETHPETKLAFNPGSHQLRSDIQKLRGVLSKTHLLYVNREEAETITAFGPSAGREKELLHAVSDMGPHIVIVTDGPNGAYVYNGQSYLYAPVFPQEAIERTGAGDAFGSGCLSALIKGKTLEEALLWGSLNSASVISKVGAETGLLKEQEMQEWLEKAHKAGIMVKEL